MSPASQTFRQCVACLCGGVMVCGLLGCARPGKEALPYQFRSAMLRSKSQLEADATQHSSTYRARVARRCRAQLDRQFAGDDPQQTLLFRCLDKAFDWRRLQTKVSSKRPERGDIAVFGDGTTPRLGLIVGVDGPRVTFVYVHAERARLGFLNVTQPNARWRGHRIENSYMQTVIRTSSPPAGYYLAAKLFRGVITLDDV